MKRKVRSVTRAWDHGNGWWWTFDEDYKLRIYVEDTPRRGGRYRWFVDTRAPRYVGVADGRAKSVEAAKKAAIHAAETYSGPVSAADGGFARFSGIGLGEKRYGFNAFYAGYVEAALFSETDNADESGGEPLDSNYGPDDFAPETQREMRKDAMAFYERAIAPNMELGEKIDDRRAGALFWWSRNGHGTGFFDEPGGTLGDRLQKIAESYGTYDLYIGDDGKIYGG